MGGFRSKLGLALVLAITLAPGRGKSAPLDSLPQVLSRIDQGAAKFKGLQADVKKKSYTAVIQETSDDSGTIAVKLRKAHDLHMVIDFRQPDAKTVEIAGTTVNIYYPKRKAVDSYDLGKNNRGLVEQFLLLGFGSNSRDLQSAYTVSLGGPEAVAGKETTRIVLIPKKKELLAQYPKFELWIADDTGIAVQQKVYAPGGDYSLATYTNMQINPDLPDSAVKLNLPPGVHWEYPQK